MAVTPNWTLQGDWFDTCNCEIQCPCMFGEAPTSGHCEGTLTWHIRCGHYGDVRLDGFTVMAVGAFDGNIWEGKTKATIGLFLDERADDHQREALQQIFAGRAGGWPAVFASLVGEVRGIESARIDYSVEDGLASWRAEIPGRLTSGAKAFGGSATHPVRSRTIASYGTSTVDSADAFGFTWSRTGLSSKHMRFDWSGPGRLSPDR
jgi:hypothetical protein